MSSSDWKNGSRAFRICCLTIDFGSSFAAFGVIAGYLIVLFDLSSAESLALGCSLFGWAGVMGLASEGGRRLQNASIIRFLDDVAPGFQDDEDRQGSGLQSRGPDASIAYRAIVSLPIQMQKARLFGGLATILVIPPMMWIFGFESWMTAERIRSFAIISLVTSLIGGALLFYWAKRAFGDWRILIAGQAAVFEPGVGEGAARPYSLDRKLLVAVVVPTLASILLVVDIVGESRRDASERVASEWASLVVDSISFGDSSLSLADRISRELPATKFWPMPIEVIEIRADRVDASASGSDLSRRFLDLIDGELQIGHRFGVVISDGGSEIGAFRKMDDGTTLVANVMRSDFERRRSTLDWATGLISVCMILIGVAVARLTAGDIVGSVKDLEQTIARIAEGDLGPGIHCELEDEFGDVGREIELVRQRLRATVSRVSDTVESVERIAMGISDIAGDVVAANSDQARQIQQAAEVLGSIDERVAQATRSVDELGGAFDESSSSVIELGAAGDELNETASILSSKVDAVSGSLEQMIRSVAQVAGTSDKLASASEETSSSMEEMASSMRAVDTSAETTASLSREVVRIAELGQAKVVQTIAGMDAIREATDAAERVIRGLGARTHEIGGILDVIDDVADETNLLALNAAIIAAQAGDQGRAFSVVADEIKALADRVLASTKEIGGLIRAVQEESENAIGAIEAGSASVMSGVDLSAEAGRTLEEITVASRESGNRISEIFASVREQTKAASHVASLMERVRESAEEIGSAGNEQGKGHDVVYESAHTMREAAQQVRRTTEDQAREFGRIRENIDGMREAVERIAGSLSEQTGACCQVNEFLDEVSRRAITNEDAAERMRVATRELVAQSEALREESERFRV